MTGMFDSHAHYFDERFSDRESCPGGVDALLDRLFGSGEIAGIVNVGTDLATSRLAVAQAERYPHMYVAVGVHPSDAQRCSDRFSAIEELRRFLSDRPEKIVAIGEIGLDYHYPDTDRKVQAAWLEDQLTLAEQTGLPVIIHDREAHGDCYAAIAAHPQVTGVFHSYSGSAEMARDLIRRGYMISFSGTLTFRNATRVAEVAASLPHDCVLVETDCPYLAPHPHRGALNHSGYLVHTLTKLGELWGLRPEEAASVTAENARRFFRLP